MKTSKLILIFALAIYSVAAVGQNLNKYYVSRAQDIGTLYFIFPMDLFENKNAGTLTMDFTKLSSRDSVTINYTVILPQVKKIQTVTFTQGQQTRVYPSERIYVEPGKRDKMIHRYTVSVPYAEFKNIFDPDTSVTMTVSDEQTGIEFKQRNGWKSDTSIIGRIVSVMDSN